MTNAKLGIEFNLDFPFRHTRHKVEDEGHPSGNDQTTCFDTFVANSSFGMIPLDSALILSIVEILAKSE